METECGKAHAASRPQGTPGKPSKICEYSVEKDDIIRLVDIPMPTNVLVNPISHLAAYYHNGPAGKGRYVIFQGADKKLRELSLAASESTPLTERLEAF